MTDPSRESRKPASATGPSVEKLSFEKALAELEQLVEQIESGEIGLEEALKRYERGVALIKRCRTVLDSAEQRIAELTTNAKGELQASEQAEQAHEQEQDREGDERKADEADQ